MTGAEADSFSMDQLGLPFRLRRGVLEMIMVIVEAFFVQVVSQHGIPYGFSCKAGVCAGLVKRNRILGGEHPDIREDGSVVLGMAVAIGRDVHDERNVETLASADDGLRVLGHLGIEDGDCLVLGKVNRIEVASAEAAAASYAVRIVHMHLPGY